MVSNKYTLCPINIQSVNCCFISWK